MDARPSENVLAEAIRIAEGDAAKARDWYFNMPLRELNGRTAACAVEDGDEQRVLRLLELYELGSLG